MLRRIVDSLPQHVFWKDRESRYLGCNVDFARVAGVGSPAEIVGKSDFDLAWRTEEAEFFRECDRRVMESGAPEFHIIEPQLQAGGRQAWVDTSKVPLRGEDGRVFGLLGIYEDITEQVEAQQLLRRRSSLLQALSYAAETFLDNPSWEDSLEQVLGRLGEVAEVGRVFLGEAVHADGDVALRTVCEWFQQESAEARPLVARSPGLRQLGLGRWVDELQARRVVAAHAAELPDRERGVLEAAGVGAILAVPVFVGDCWWGVLGFADSSGTRRWSAAETEALRAAAGLVGAAIRRHLVEDELRRQKEQFEQLFVNTPLAILMADSEDRIVAVNPAFEALFGFSRSEARGHAVNELITPDGLAAEGSELSRITLGGVPAQAETVRRRKDGTLIPVQVFGVPVVMDGPPIAVYGLYVDLRERKRAEERLLRSALYDPLTGLPNRGLFLDRVEVAMLRSRARGDRPFAVIVLNVDRFKRVNESLGHAVGDELINAIAGRLEDGVALGNTVARLNADEFAVLVSELDDVTASAREADRLRHLLSEPFAVSDDEVYVTVSAGIAYSSSGHHTPSEIMRDADTALHRAKALGGNRHAVFDEAMHTRAVSLLRLETDLRRALDRGELVLHYQPIVTLDGEKIVAFEALVRWQHPERGLLLPAHFLPLAEETGLIRPIGEWTLAAACAEASRWVRAGRNGSTPAVSVNLPSREFTRPELVQRIERTLSHSGLAPGKLQLEVTEGAIIDEPERAVAILARLRELGVKVHLDDFGTGYSSLSYLQRFAVDALKIDRSFVGRMGITSGAEIVAAIVGLAHSLGMEALGEGVETVAQAERLRALECDLAQGFYFSRPVPEQEAVRMVENGALA